MLGRPKCLLAVYLGRGEYFDLLNDILDVVVETFVKYIRVAILIIQFIR